MEGCLLLVENESSSVYYWMLTLALLPFATQSSVSLPNTKSDVCTFWIKLTGLWGCWHSTHGLSVPRTPRKLLENLTLNIIADENKTEAIFRCYLKTLGWPLDENRPSWSISSYFRRKPKVFVRPNDADEDDADAVQLKILSRRIFSKIVDSRICFWSDESSHCQVVERNRWRFEFFLKFMWQ